MAFVLALLQDGRLRALAVAAKEPVADPIGIPTALSQGVDYQYATWYGILAPGKTPRPVLEEAQFFFPPEINALLQGIIQNSHEYHSELLTFAELTEEPPEHRIVY